MNNTKIYKLLGNLNHNGTAYQQGSYVSDDVFGGNTYQLEADGVIKEVEGATTIEEAMALDGVEAEAEAAAEEAEIEPENTWGPKPDKTDEEIAAEELANKAPEGGDDEIPADVKVFEGEMATYKVLNPIEYTDENGENPNTLEVDSLQTVPRVLGDAWVINGDAEEVPAPTEEKVEEKKGFMAGLFGGKKDADINPDNL